MMVSTKFYEKHFVIDFNTFVNFTSVSTSTFLALNNLSLIMGGRYVVKDFMEKKIGVKVRLVTFVIVPSFQFSNDQGPTR